MVQVDLAKSIWKVHHAFACVLNQRRKLDGFFVLFHETLIILDYCSQYLAVCADSTWLKTLASICASCSCNSVNERLSSSSSPAGHLGYPKDTASISVSFHSTVASDFFLLQPLCLIAFKFIILDIGDTNISILVNVQILIIFH